MIYICHICHIGHMIYHHNIQILYDVCIIQPYLAKFFLQFGPRLHLSSFPSFTFFAYQQRQGQGGAPHGGSVESLGDMMSVYHSLSRSNNLLKVS